MGEYAKRKSDGQKVKIGTCEAMYYLRYEDRDKIEPTITALNLYWRLPFPDEDNVKIGEYLIHDRGVVLCKADKLFSCPEFAQNPGTIQLRHRLGILLNVACYHGVKLPAETNEVKAFWNGKAPFLYLTSLKNTAKGIRAVVSCKGCGGAWSFEISEVVDFIQDKELQARIMAYGIRKGK